MTKNTKENPIKIVKNGKKCDMLNQVDQVSTKLFENQIDAVIALNHHVFNEREAAFYCRCSVDSIRYHVLRSRKLTFCDFTKEGIVFLKSDLDKFLVESRKIGYRG